MPANHCVVARRMIGGRVERVEAMVFVLDFRAIRDDETNFAEAADDVVGDLGEGMQLPEDGAAAGKAEIGRLFGESAFEFEFATAFREELIDFRFGLVNELASAGAFLLRKRAELFHQRGEGTICAEVLDARLIKRGKVGSGREVRDGGVF